MILVVKMSKDHDTGILESGWIVTFGDTEMESLYAKVSLAAKQLLQLSLEISIPSTGDLAPCLMTALIHLLRWILHDTSVISLVLHTQRFHYHVGDQAWSQRVWSLNITKNHPDSLFKVQIMYVMPLLL